MGLAVPTVRTGRALAAALDEIEGDPTAVVRAVTQTRVPWREPESPLNRCPPAAIVRRCRSLYGSRTFRLDALGCCDGLNQK